MDSSFEKRRTATVAKIIEELVASGKDSLRPGDVNAVLRERGMPMGTWEVRAEFTKLEAQEILSCEAATGNWVVASADALREAV